MDKNSPPCSVPRRALSLSSCTFLPGRQTVKTPSQKDVLSFVTWITVCVWVGVCHRGQYFQMSLFVTLTFKCLIYPQPPVRNRSRHFRPLGKWSDPCDIASSSVCPPLNGFLISTLEMRCLVETKVFCFFFPPRQKSGSTTQVSGSGHRKLNQIY